MQVSEWAVQDVRGRIETVLTRSSSQMDAKNHDKDRAEIEKGSLGKLGKMIARRPCKRAGGEGLKS